MADEGGIILLEGGIPKHVVGMHVGIDDVADGFVCDGLDSVTQTAPNQSAAAGIDDCHGVFADDYAEIRNISRVFGGDEGVTALMDE